jgi:hypothetical protein
MIDLDKVTIKHSNHEPQEPSNDASACALEWVSILAGESWSDRPKCACPVISDFVRTWNDCLPDDESRGRLLKPLIPLLIGTRSTSKVERVRAWMVVDWDMRVRVPAWLRLEGFEDFAKALESGPEIVDLEGLEVIGKTARAAYRAAENAAYSAAENAAENAAKSAAYSAARSAARSAAESSLKPTVTVLQLSAQNLVKRLCEVKARKDE